MNSPLLEKWTSSSQKVDLLQPWRSDSLRRNDKRLLHIFESDLVFLHSQAEALGMSLKIFYEGALQERETVQIKSRIPEGTHESCLILQVLSSQAEFQKEDSGDSLSKWDQIPAQWPRALTRTDSQFKSNERFGYLWLQAHSSLYLAKMVRFSLVHGSGECNSSSGFVPPLYSCYLLPLCISAPPLSSFVGLELSNLSSWDTNSANEPTGLISGIFLMCWDLYWLLPILESWFRKNLLMQLKQFY